MRDFMTRMRMIGSGLVPHENANQLDVDMDMRKKWRAYLAINVCDNGSLGSSRA